MPTSAKSSIVRLARAALGIGNTDLREKLDDPPFALGAVEIEMRLQRFADLKADGEAGIE